MKLAISLLGPFRVALDGQPVTEFEADSARALLAYLALSADFPFRRGTLAGTLWPEQPTSKALHNLRQALYRLQRAIKNDSAVPPFLKVTRRTIQFNPVCDHYLDVTAFNDLVAATRHHPHRRPETCRRCMAQLKDAADLYHGDLMTGFSLDSMPFMEWLAVRRERLHRQAMDVFFNLAAYFEAQGEFQQARHYAQRQIELEPWREEAHQQLMRVLAMSGQRSAALAQYDICRDTLIKELGVEPATETMMLFSRIEGGHIPGPFLSLPGQLGGHNLLPATTPLIGREAELERIVQRLLDPAYRLVSVVGPGGVGKTRLARAVAERVLEEFAHGVWFIDLTGDERATQPDAIPLAVAGPLRIALTGRQAPAAEVLDFLRDKETLLVLDGLERLIDEGVTFVLQVLRRAPGVTLLATSRERLNLLAEVVVQLEGLPIPPSAFEEGARHVAAVRLFVERARRSAGRFVLDDEALENVVAICAAVEGLPLAIELAAAQVGQIDLGTIARRVHKNLGELTSSMRDLPARHRSMSAVFAGSWDLLTPQEQEALARAAVFAGGFDEVAGETVTGAPRSVLRGLVDKSLLRWHDERFWMREPLRHFIADRLERMVGLEEGARERHSTYYLGMLAREREALMGQGAQEAVARIGRDLENVRQAWRWAAATGATAALERSVDPLTRFYNLLAAFAEGEALFGEALTQLKVCLGQAGPLSSDALCLIGKLMIGTAQFLNAQAKYGRAEAIVRAALEETGPNQTPACRAIAHLELGRALWSVGSYLAAREEIERALQLAEDKWIAAQVEIELGIVFRSENRLKDAEDHVSAALARCRELGDRRSEGVALRELGRVAMEQGDYETAIAHYRDSVTAFQEVGDVVNERETMLNLGVILSRRGMFDQAQVYYDQALASFRASGYRRGECVALGDIGKIYLWRGDLLTAKRYLEPALRISREIGAREEESDLLNHLGWLARRLGQVDAARDYSEQAIRLCRAVGSRRCEAHGLVFLGRALTEAERWEEADEAYRSALSLWGEIDPANTPLEALAGIVEIALLRGRAGDGVGYAERIVTEIERQPELTEAHEPFWIYWVVYRVLKATGDERAARVLSAAYALLEERAARIADEQLRQSYLENVPAHRDILRAVDGATIERS